MNRRIAIVGGGVAGIAAAVAVARAGEAPILIETKRKLGGRATSFGDPRSGRVLDNCQHVLMGCCTNLIDLYERLGTLERIEWHKATYWANPPGEPDVLRCGRLPAPAHQAFGFLTMRQLARSEKQAIGRAMWRLIRMGFRGRLPWRGRIFGEFLRETGQPSGAIDRFWEPVVVSACNATCERCDAAYAMQVFQEGFLGSAWGSTMGLSTVPLLDLYEACLPIVEEAGGELRLGESARGLAYDGERIGGVVTDEGFVSAAAVISAVPPDRLDKLCSVPLKHADRRLRHLADFAMTPIVGVHLFFEAKVMETPHLVLPGRGTQWLFDKGPVGDGLWHLHAVISAADRWVDLDEATIVRRVMDDVHWALPRAKGLEPREVRSVKERRATFALVPGIDELRPTSTPDARGGVRNLFLAGDWTLTGWPATMEGAVRSGYAAAAAATGKGGVVPDVPPGRVARWLGLK